MSTFPSDKPERRRNIYLKNPAIFEAFQMAIKKGILKGNGASDRIEHLIKADLRKMIPKLRRAGVTIPEAVFAK